MTSDVALHKALDLIGEHDSPLFVYDYDSHIHDLNELKQTFDRVFPKNRLFYSVKTNPITAICQAAQRHGYGLEVVSGTELEFVLSLGVAGREIVFNGPYKRKEEIELALEAGVCINCDSIEEMEMVADCVIGEKRSLVGLRLDPNIDGWHKFGTTKEDIVKHLHNSTGMPIDGIHFHIGEKINQLDNVLAVFTEMGELLDTLPMDVARSMRFIDIGGGFVQTICDRNQIEKRPRPIEEIFQGIASQTRANPTLKGIEIWAEPGRYVVCSNMHLICKVGVVKEKNGDRIAICDGNTNHIPNLTYEDHEIINLSGMARPTPTGGVVVYGPLSADFDRLGEVPMNGCEVGDVLLIKNVGAYSVAFSNQFGWPRPAVVEMRRKEDRIEIVRNREQKDAFWINDSSSRR